MKFAIVVIAFLVMACAQQETPIGLFIIKNINLIQGSFNANTNAFTYVVPLDTSTYESVARFTLRSPNQAWGFQALMNDGIMRCINKAVNAPADQRYPITAITDKTTHKLSITVNNFPLALVPKTEDDLTKVRKFLLRNCM